MLKSLIQTLIVLLFLGIAIYVFNKKYANGILKELEEKNKKLELRFDTLNKRNDSLKLFIEKYQNEIDSLKNYDSKLSNQYDENKKQLKNLKDKYEKNNRIDNYTTPDIIKYFTDSL